MSRSRDEEVARLMAAVPDPPSLAACWLDSPAETLGEFADRTQRLMTLLGESHAAFRDLYLIGNSKKDSPSLAPDLSNLRPWILRRSWHENAPTNASYSHRSADGSLTERSTGEMGFAVDLGNLQPPEFKLRLTISSGSPRGGSVAFTLPAQRADDLCSINAVKSMLQAALDAWPVRCGFVTTRAWHDLVNPAAHDWLDLPIGGITYSSDATIAEALPQGAEWEPFGDDGILIKITERPDRLEPDAVKRAIAVRDALAAHDMLRLRRNAR